MVKNLPKKKNSFSNTRGKPRWQEEQKNKKTKTNKKVVGYWLSVTFLLLIGVLVFKVFIMFKNSVWDGNNRVNFVVSDQGVNLVSFDPQAGDLISLTIPSKTQIEVIHGYGKYRIEAISTLEEIEKRQDLLVGSLQQNFAVPIDGWIRLGDSGQGLADSKEKILGVLEKQVFGRGKTNFTDWDLVRLWWKIRQLRFDKTNFVNLNQINVLTPQALPDQTQVWEVDKNLLDSYLSKAFIDAKIRQENLTVEVLNATTRLGLGEQGARLISNLGGEVISVGNAEMQSGKCEVQSNKDKKDNYTVKRIAKVFNCGWQEKKEEGRADITLILTEDYWQKLNQK